MADLTPPQLKSLRDYCGRVPGHRPGTRTHLSTLIRWCSAGVKTPGGRRVRLRATRIGSRWFTTDAWFDAFLAEQADTLAATGADAPRSLHARSKASVAAAAELDALGLG